jgi:hypothetical protein
MLHTYWIIREYGKRSFKIPIHKIVYKDGKMVTVVYMTKETFKTKGEFLEAFGESLRSWFEENTGETGITYDDWINATPLEDLFNIVIDDSNEGISKDVKGEI